ncbi:MAG: sigma-70 family RNA polymerase sigma factor [Bacteroidota bacterium]
MTTIEFGHRVNELSLSLKPFALRLTKDLEQAEDLLQDTILKAFSNKDKFKEGTNLKAWLYTIMKNTFITNYQKMVRRKTFIDTSDNQHFINSTSETFENLAYTNFAMKDINNAIESVDDDYRIPFMMYFRGYKYLEIADMLEIPLGTVKNRIHIARKLLKNRLTIYAKK